jgi:hypothetical protein
MYCHGCQAPIGDLCAALSITVGDLFDEPLSEGRRPVRLVRPGPPPKPLTADEQDKIPDPGRLVHGLIVERDWECSAFWEYVTRPFRGEPSTPEQRVKLAEAESSRLAADQWDGWFLIHRKRGAA